MSVPTLVCVRCRNVQDGRLLYSELEEVGNFAVCGCGARFPVVDGIPIVVPELERFLAAEGPVLLERQDLAPELTEVLARGAGGSLERSRSLLASYQRSGEGPLQDWLRAQVGQLQGEVLEGGCGLGLLASSIGMDYNFGLLRASVCGRKVCGDLQDPPFPPQCFDAVVLANVVDSCADPGMVLAQADALLKPNGTLLVTCPFSFRSDLTPPSRWLTETSLLQALRGEIQIAPVLLQYQIEELVELEWPLWISPRHRSLFVTLAVRARKVSGSDGQRTSTG